MELDRTPLMILVVLTVVAAVQFVRYYNLVPATLATHFGITGQPNGWTSKTAFVSIMGGIEAALMVLAFLIARLGARFPTVGINIPNRDYWLEPARRDETLRFLWNYILWTDALLVTFLIAITEIIFRANIIDTPSLPNSFPYVVGAFVLVMVWMSLRVLLRFRRPDTA